MIYEYLKNSAFLKKMDEMPLKEQFVKIIILDFLENPITEIQGKVTSLPPRIVQVHESVSCSP